MRLCPCSDKLSHMLTPVRRAALLAVALSLVILVPGTTATAASKKSGCKAGQVPKRSSAKKVVCTTFKLPAGARPYDKVCIAA